MITLFNKKTKQYRKDNYEINFEIKGIDNMVQNVIIVWEVYFVYIGTSQKNA